MKEFYNSSSYDYEEEQEQYDESENELSNISDGPDYSEAYQLCKDIISNSGSSLKLIRRETDKKKEEISSSKKQLLFVIKKRLKDLLTDELFNKFSSNTTKYSKEWREKWILNMQTI